MVVNLFSIILFNDSVIDPSSFNRPCLKEINRLISYMLEELNNLSQINE